jgi:hypothetical protein
MDRELWTLVLATVKRAAKDVGWNGGRRAPRYPDWLVVAMYLWAVWHDRTLSWACDRAHYGGLFRPRGPLPSVSQFTRRVKSDDCRRVLQRVHDALAQRGLPVDEGYLDGKALLVSPVSKDRQATRGRVSGGFAKGYKLHAFVNEHRRVVVWSVTGLHEDEKTVALHLLLPQLPPMAPGALVLKDSNYDSAPLHKAAAEVAPEARLVGPVKGQQRVGPEGHLPVTLRQMGPRRRELLAAWQRCPGLVRHALRARDTIERTFGVLVCTAGGLGTALPPWVRTLDRVRRWVGAKLILYNARLAVQDRLRTEAAA